MPSFAPIDVVALAHEVGPCVFIALVMLGMEGWFHRQTNRKIKAVHDRLPKSED